MIIHNVLIYKTKGQQIAGGKAVSAGLYRIGGLAEGLKALDCKSGDGADTTVRPFKSDIRR
jgi:hypothetical protein